MTKQEKDLSVHNFAKLLSIRATRAWPGQDLSAAEIQKQIVEIYIRGLRGEHIRRKLVIKNPSTLDEAVKFAFEESKVQNRLTAFNLSQPFPSKQRDITQQRNETPMEVDFLQSAASHPLYGQPEPDLVATLTPDQTGFDPSIPANPSYEELSYGWSYDQPTDQQYPLAEPGLDPFGQVCDDGNPIDQFAAPIEENNQDPSTPEDPDDIFAVQGTERRCFFCNKPGHIARDCRLRQQQPKPASYSQQQPRSMPFQ